MIEIQDIIETLVTELSKSGLKAYDNEPPFDQPSPWILVVDENNQTSYTEYLKDSGGDVDNDISKTVVIRIVKLKELGMKELRVDAKKVFNLLHKKNFSIGNSNIYVHILSKRDFSIDRWNVQEQLYYIIGS